MKKIIKRVEVIKIFNGLMYQISHGNFGCYSVYEDREVREDQMYVIEFI